MRTPLLRYFEENAEHDFLDILGESLAGRAGLLAARLGNLHPTIALDPPDDVVGCGIEVRPDAMVVEFEFLAMRGRRHHNGFAAVFAPSRVEAPECSARSRPSTCAKSATVGGS